VTFLNAGPAELALLGIEYADGQLRSLAVLEMQRVPRTFVTALASKPRAECLRDLLGFAFSEEYQDVGRGILA
jgi:hypothetical protein